MEDFDYYSIGDFSTLIQLLTGFAVVFAGYNNFVYSYRKRFGKYVNFFFNGRSEKRIAINSLSNSLSPYINQNLVEEYNAFVEKWANRELYTMSVSNQDDAIIKTKKKQKKALITHFEEYASVAKPILAYTAIYGIIILIFVGFTQHDSQFLLSNGDIISSKRASYKILFVFSILSFAYIFLSFVYNLRKSLKLKNQKLPSSDTPVKVDNLSFFTKSISWAIFLLLLSVVVLLISLNFKTELINEYPFAQKIHFQPIVSFISFFIVVLGYPLLYLATFIRYKIHIFVEDYLFHHNADFISNQFMKLIDVSTENQFSNESKYESPRRRNLYFSFFFKQYSIHLGVVMVLFISVFITYYNVPESNNFHFKKLIEDSNMKRLDVFENYEKMSNANISKAIEKYYIKDSQAYNDVFKVIESRKKNKYHLDISQLKPFIKDFRIINQDKNHIVINTIEHWSTHWTNNKKDDLWYIGDISNYQTYVLKKIGNDWKIEANHYSGDLKETIEGEKPLQPVKNLTPPSKT